METDRVDEFVIVGRDVETKHFLTEVILAPNQQNDLFAFIGVLSALKLELTEQSQLSPALLLDGTIADPNQEERESHD